ncbi:MAG: hypothetical protein CVU52_04765 [Deltaproteobacteria bacterium HGW-Deltaproteobacteria-10]|nr:MAG: hypothetical protein CVU52_04765 [Deltaproteobacteria bacterium HGW-Deltaproteobacteria-10]
MPAIISLKNIDEAIDSLNYKSETTLKSKLIRAVRNFYPDESSLETLTSIDTEELVKFIWDTGDNAELIKTKRKNFSSVKSSVNTDLKKLYSDGKNPQGIIIGPSNIFDISAEAKNKALSSIADIARGKGIDTGSNISEILSALTETLAGAMSSANAQAAREEIDRLKNLIGEMTGEQALPAEALSVPDKTTAAEGIPPEQKSKALAGIADILKDKSIDAETRMSKIMEAVKEVLAEAISAAGAALDTQEAEQIKNLFGNLSETREPAMAEEGIAASGEINKITTAVKDMLADALAAAGADLNSDAIDRIKNLFGTLAENVKSALSTGRGLDGIGIDSGDGEEAVVVEEAPEGEIIEEVVEEVVADEPALEAVAEDKISAAEEYLPDAEIEEIPVEPDAGSVIIEEETAATEVVEIIEEVIGDELTEPPAEGEITAEAPPEEIAAPDAALKDDGLPEEPAGPPDGQVQEKDYEEIIEIDDSMAPPQEALPEETVVESLPEEIVAEDTIVEAAETSADYTTEETTATDTVEEVEAVEVVEELAPEEVVEILEEPLAGEEEAIPEQDQTAGVAVEGDLRTKAEILAELAAAAAALEKIGPDLSNSIYSEEEIKEKAKFLSEEFDRYLSVREKFYNQHILIKGGSYRVGGAGLDKNELAEQIADLREFYIGKFPVTNALFEIFVEKTGYITTAEKHGFGFVYIPRMQKVKNVLTGAESFIWNNQLQHKRMPGACWYRPNGESSTLYVKRTHPVVQVSLEDACAFAAWTGKRIPTEQEWEAAARTSSSYLYPWGNSWQDDACNLENSLLGDTAPVDQYVKFANEYEVADTLGNVLEWTLDHWQEPGPDEESVETYVVKGASWASGIPVSLTDRQPVYKDTSSNILGFRCIAI